MAICALVAAGIAVVPRHAPGIALIYPFGAFLNDPGVATPSDPRLRFDSRVMFRNTINGGAIAIGDEWVLHRYHALFPATGGGVDGYVGHLLDQFDNAGQFLGTFRVIASREDPQSDVAVFRVARVVPGGTEPAALPVWVDAQNPIPPHPGIALWGSYGPQRILGFNPDGMPIQDPPHPRLMKWGTTGSDGFTPPGLTSDARFVAGDSGSGRFVRDGFNLRLLSVEGPALTPAIRQQLGQWVQQMGGNLVRPPLELGEVSTSSMPVGGDWFAPSTWSSGSPGAGDTAWIDQHATVSVHLPVASAANVYVGVNDVGMLTVASALAGLGVGSLIVGVNESAAGTVLLQEGSIATGSADVGYRGAGVIEHGGGALAVTGTMVLGREREALGVYTVGPGASATIGTLLVGREGVGTVLQSGGSVITNVAQVGQLSGGVGYYTLGDGTLRVDSTLSIGQHDASIGTLLVSGGQLDARRLNVLRGTFEMSGGSVETTLTTLAPGATFRVSGGDPVMTEGGTLAGTVDFTGASGRLTVGGLADLSAATIIGQSSATLALLPHGLAILPPGAAPGSFGWIDAAASSIVHVEGDVLDIPSGKDIRVAGAIRDFVRVHGALLVTQGLTGGDLVLGAGFEVGPSGVLRMGDAGNATVIGAPSGNAGGDVSGGSMIVLPGSRFEHSAGTSHFARQVNVISGGTLSIVGGTFSAGSMTVRGTVEQSAGLLDVAGSGVTLHQHLNQSGGESRYGSIETPVSQSAGIAVSGGTMSVGRVRGPGVALSGSAVLKLDANGSPSSTRVFRGLSIEPPGPTLLLDIEHLVVEYIGSSPLASLTEAIAAGRAGGAWTGTGITSSVAAGDPQFLAVGIAEASSLGLAQFGDYNLSNQEPGSSTAVLFRLTVAGDADLSGSVNLGDFSRLGINFNLPGGWSDGDFDYNGVVDVGDFSILAANFNKSFATPARVVPEPGIAAGLGALLFLANTRRVRRK